jgi:uncharacterized membrane protein YgdD (TMEM256/DUF423 family)
MARLLMFLALVVIATAVLIAALAALAVATRSLDRAGRELETGTTVQNIAYIALLVLLVGVVTGWLGGL